MKGIDNPPNYMSRPPIPLERNESTRAANVAEEYVNFAVSHATPTALTLEETKSVT